jgi:hypothetical protein
VSGIVIAKATDLLMNAVRFEAMPTPSPKLYVQGHWGNGTTWFRGAESAPDVGLEAAVCAATVQHGVRVAAGLPTSASKLPRLQVSSERAVSAAPFDTASKRAIPVEEQLPLGLLQARATAAAELARREAKAKAARRHEEVPFGARFEEPLVQRETVFDSRLRRAAGSSDTSQRRMPPPAPRRPVVPVARQEMPSARGAEGAQNFLGMPLPAAVQSEIQPDGLPPTSAPFWGPANPQRQIKPAPELQRVVTEPARGHIREVYYWRAGGYRWTVVQSAFSEDAISPELVRIIYRYIQDPVNCPPPPEAEQALLPFLQRAGNPSWLVSGLMACLLGCMEMCYGLQCTCWQPTCTGSCLH